MKNLRWLNRQLETLDDTLAQRNERPADLGVCRQDMAAWRERFEAHKAARAVHAKARQSAAPARDAALRALRCAVPGKFYSGVAPPAAIGTY